MPLPRSEARVHHPGSEDGRCWSEMVVSVAGPLTCGLASQNQDRYLLFDYFQLVLLISSFSSIPF